MQDCKVENIMKLHLLHLALFSFYFNRVHVDSVCALNQRHINTVNAIFFSFPKKIKRECILE